MTAANSMLRPWRLQDWLPMTSGPRPATTEAAAGDAGAPALAARPPWRESDPRWRRRMVAGAWVLTLVPLMEVLYRTGWVSSIVVPGPLNVGRNTLDGTMTYLVWERLAFCIGVVLLFAKEADRASSRLDWTRRLGVVASYWVFLLGMLNILFLTALVMTGIGAVFVELPLRYQPAATQWFVQVSTGYLAHGPHPGRVSDIALPMFSAVAVLLASVALLDALRSSGPKWLAVAVLSPLLVAGLLQLVDPVRTAQNFYLFETEGFGYPFYFNSKSLLNSLSTPNARSILEAAKWASCAAAAVWMTIAQVSAWRREK